MQNKLDEQELEDLQRILFWFIMRKAFDFLGFYLLLIILFMGLFKWILFNFVNIFLFQLTRLILWTHFQFVKKILLLCLFKIKLFQSTLLGFLKTCKLNGMLRISWFCIWLCFCYFLHFFGFGKTQQWQTRNIMKFKLWHKKVVALWDIWQIENRAITITVAKKTCATI